MPDSRYPFPVVRPPEEAEAEQLFLLFEATEANCHHFTLAVPPNCQLIDGPPPDSLSEEIPHSSLLRLHRGAGAPLWIEVGVHRLTRELAPADWLALVEGLDKEVLDSHHTPGVPGREAEILTRHRGSDGRTYVSRYRVTKDGLTDGGAQMIVIMARVAEEDYVSTASEILGIVSSLHLRNATNFPFAENLKTFSRPLPGDFLLHYPASWSLREVDSEEVEGGLLELSIEGHLEDEPLGRITFLVTGMETSEELLCAQYLRGLSDSGLNLEMKPLASTPAFGGLDRAWTTCSSAPSEASVDADHQMTLSEAMRSPSAPDAAEATVSIGTLGHTWYLVAWVGLSHPLASALNRRAFEIVRDLIRSSPTPAPPPSPPTGEAAP